MRAVWASLVAAILLTPAGWTGYRLWPRPLVIRPVALIPVCDPSAAGSIVTLPNRFLVASIARYDDELYAYLMFTYLRGSRAFRNSEMLLTFHKSSGAIEYLIQVRLANDLLSSLDLLARAKAGGLISDYEWRWVYIDTYQGLQYQTGIFETAYNRPSQRSLESLTRPELEDYIQRFVAFKSATDRRVRASAEAAPKPLTAPQA